MLKRFLELGQMFASARGSRLQVRPESIHHVPKFFGILRSVGYPARECQDIVFGAHFGILA